MTTCQDCQHYECTLDDHNVIESEICNAPLPIFIEIALRCLDCNPEDYWDPATAWKFCTVSKAMKRQDDRPA